MIFLITGANRGLGLEYTQQLLAQKHKVIAWARKPETSKDLKALQEKYADQLVIEYVDVNSYEEIKKAAQKITALDVLINNAGVLLDGSIDLESLTPEILNKTFQTNVFAPIFVTQQVLPVLSKSINPLVVHMSSLMGSISDNSSGGYYAYRMSKTALNMFSKSLSHDFPKIKTICLHPGWVQTDMGGPNAPTQKSKSIEGLLKIILNPEKFETGSFINFSGKEIAW